MRGTVGVAVAREVAVDQCLPSCGRTCINAKPPLEFAKFPKMQNQYTKLLERCFVNFSKNQECKSNMQNC